MSKPNSTFSEREGIICLPRIIKFREGDIHEGNIIVIKYFFRNALGGRVAIHDHIIRIHIFTTQDEIILNCVLWWW